MAVGLRKKSQLGELPYTIEPRAVQGHAQRFAIIRCDEKGCDHSEEFHCDAPGRPLPLEVINKRFAGLGWHVRRHHNRCPEHNGRAPRKILKLATIPDRFKPNIVPDPVEAVKDVQPIKAAASLSHVHESKVAELSEAHQLNWYMQAFEREKRKNERSKKEKADLLRAFTPIANLARDQFSGSGVIWDDETAWADHRTVSFNVNFALLKNAVRAVEGYS